MRTVNQKRYLQQSPAATRRRANNGKPRRRTILEIEALETRVMPTIVTIGAGKDNTLIESPTGSLSNGAGQFFFAGKTAQQSNALRRGVIAFDIAANVPAGATINSVSLRLNMSKTLPGSQTVELRRLTGNWGEGTSDAGGNEGAGAPATTNDATWIHRFFNTSTWTAAGGDFVATVSASVSVGDVAAYTWGSTAQMVADVQGWLNSPANNFGWIVLGNEAAASSAKRFDTKENLMAANRPALTIDYTAAGVAPNITSGNATTFTVGAAGTFNVTATGTPTPTLSSTGTLPTGVTFNAGTGVLGGTPAAGTGGTYPITFAASNGVPPNAIQNFTLTVNQAPAITSGNNTAFTVGTAGSFTVTATGFPAPTLSMTGALPTGVTFNTGTGALSGTPAAGTGGTYPIMFTASNGVAPNATQNFTFTVNQAPAITSANNDTFAVGAADSFTVTTTGFPAPTLSVTGALPSGVTFNTGTGALSGTPAAGTGGTYPIMFTASNGVAPNATQNFTLTVNQAPAITSVNSTTFTVGAAGNFTVTATGFPAPTLSQSGALPTGLTFNVNTGVLSGTPEANTGGSYPIMFMAANGVGSNATQNFTLTVNQAPAITSNNNMTFTVGAAGTFTVTATGFPAPALSVSGNLPAGVTFNTDTGVLSGTPAAGTGGSYPLTFTAANGVSPNATQNFTLTINQAPSITSAASVIFAPGILNSFTVTATGFPTPTLSATGALPGGVSFNSSTGVLSGTPAAGTDGNYPITFTAANGVGADANQNFTLTVDQSAAPPAITSANNTTFTVGAAGTFTVTATGNPTPTLGQTGSLPTGVTFDAGTGVLGGTPAAGTGGSYPITFTAANGVGTNATQNFTLTINQAPAITSANNTTFTVGTAGTFTVTATGFPAPSLSVTGALPGGVTFNTGTGELGGTPAAGTSGTYPITFTASNGVAPNATQNFTLTVNQAPAITSANSTTFTVGAAGSFNVTATGFPAPILNQTGALPAGVTFNTNTGVLSGTPDVGTGGTYPLTFTASNGVAPNATQNFTLTVNQAPAITSANNTTFTVGVAGTFTVTATGFPAPALSDSGTLPAGVSFNPGTGALSGTPAQGTGGTYPLTFTASNGVAPNATQNFTLTVNQPVVPPVVTSFTPISGPPGVLVTITGTGFTNANAVTFGGVSAGNFTVKSATQIAVVVPAGAATGLIGVSTPAGTAASSTSFSVTAIKTAFATGSAGQFPSGIAVGDFDGDGKLDTATANYAPRLPLGGGTYTTGDTVSVLFGTGTGAFTGTTLTLPLPTGTSPFGIATGKFVDGSNNVSIVTGNFTGQSASVFLGNGNGTFQAPLMLPAKDAANGLHKIVQVAVGDLNGDNRQDIVAASGDGTYTVFLGNGNGTFNPLPSRSALTPIFGIAIANIDSGSGPKPSLIAAAFAAWKVAVLPGNGDGTFKGPIFTNVGSGTSAQTGEFLGVGDFNGDGKTDVAVSNKDTNNVSILLGNGNGAFGAATTLAVGTTPLGISVSDINKDGALDVAVANLNSNSISVLLGNGNGSFGPAQSFGSAQQPIAIAAGDFNPTEGALDLVFTNFVGFQQDKVTIAKNNAAAPPIINSFTPLSGSIGSPVVIMGANFFGVTAITFNGVPANNFAVNSPTQITVFVPTGASSGLIRVTAAGGIGVSAEPFTVAP